MRHIRHTFVAIYKLSSHSPTQVSSTCAKQSTKWTDDSSSDCSRTNVWWRSEGGGGHVTVGSALYVSWTPPVTERGAPDTVK